MRSGLERNYEEDILQAPEDGSVVKVDVVPAVSNLEIATTLRDTARRSGDVVDDAFGANVNSFVNGLPRKQGAVDFSKLEKIGKGGSHDVYRDPNNPTFVVKIDRDHLAADANTFKRAQEYVDQRNKKNDGLYGGFGYKNCARESMFITKGIFPGMKQGDKDVLLIVQEQNEALSAKGVVDFGFNDKQKWRDGIVRKIRKDQGFMMKVKEFLLRFKEFFNKTGNFIDLIGEKNVVFYKDEKGEWQYKIGSVLKGDTRDGFARIYREFVKDPKKFMRTASEADINCFNNGVAAAKALNEMGMSLGIGTVAYIPVEGKGINDGA